MKTSTLPPLRVEPGLRNKAERVLRDGETLSSFIVDAVEERVRNRDLEEEFIERGLAAGREAARTGKYYTAASVLAELRNKLERSKLERSKKKRKAR